MHFVPFIVGRMAEEMNKRKKFPILKIIMLVAFLYFGWTFLNQQKIIDEKKLQDITLSNQIEEQQKTKNNLKKKKSIINSDEFIEKVAREKLGLLKDGEKKFIDANNR